MNILRYLRPECIELGLEPPPVEVEENESDAQRERRLVHVKEAVLQELADILDRSGQIANPTKFYKDLVNRERKATTAVAPGVAIPHVRSMQVRQFIMGFARSDQGVPFGSLDGGPTHLFFLLASPPYDDKVYLKVYREFAELIQRDGVVDRLRAAPEPQDVINVLREHVTA